MRVALFKDSQASFLQALNEAGIPFEKLKAAPGSVMASGAMVIIAQTVAIVGAIAPVLVAWLKGRASRKIILTLQDRTIIHVEGYSLEQVRELIPLIASMAVIDTSPAEQSNPSLQPTASGFS